MTGFDPALTELSPLLYRVLSAIPEGEPIFLVGGAIRDLFLKQVSHDLDFAVPGDALKIARKVANGLGAAFFPLNVEHETGRVLLIGEEPERLVLDFTRFRGPDLESDLRLRDLTINAIALDLRNPQSVIDPLEGVKDLQNGVLRPCAPSAFAEDPLRILRAVRMAIALSFKIPPGTQVLMRESASGLAQISPERVRDEIFHQLEGPSPDTGIRLLERFGALQYTLPELELLQSLQQPPPHIYDVWTHTLGTLRELEKLLGVLGPVYDEDASSDLIMGLLVQRIGRYRGQISDHLRSHLSPDRTLRSLLFFSALYHDIGKPESHQVSEKGEIHFYDHPQIGAKMAGHRARHLCLSRRETDRLQCIIRNHMRPLFLANSGEMPSQRSVYRFFRDTGPAGVDICLLSLADTLATYGPTLTQDRWADQLNVVRELLESWWERRKTRIDPPPLLRGSDLIDELNLEPGPVFSLILEFLHEAQVTDQIATRAEALALAREWLADQG
jgi:poly(A) polymerase